MEYANVAIVAGTVIEKDKTQITVKTQGSTLPEPKSLITNIQSISQMPI